MLSCLMISCLIGAGLDQAGPPARQIDWQLDKTSVMEGGCVTLLLRDPPAPLRSISLRIKGRPPIPLSMAGPVIEGKETVYVLLGYDMVNREGFRKVAGGGIATVPVFSPPGTVALQLEYNGCASRKVIVTVHPIEDDARPSMRLLFPIVSGKDAPAESRWPQLIMKKAALAGGMLDRRILDMLRADLPTVRKHPDWAELADVLTAIAEAKSMQLQSNEHNPSKGNGQIEAGKPMNIRHLDTADLQHVSRALTEQFSSPFARELQTSTLGRCAHGLQGIASSSEANGDG